MDALLPLQFYLEKVLHDIGGGILNWAAKLRSFRSGAHARVVPGELHYSKDALAVACLLLRISNVSSDRKLMNCCLHKR